MRSADSLRALFLLLRAVAYNACMLIGHRLRALREAKSLSQGDIEKRTGLLRSYLLRVENGHTVPAVETLEKLARALEVPLYQLFYEGKEPPKLLKIRKVEEVSWGRTRSEIRFWHKLLGLLARIEESDRRLLLHTAQKMAKR